MDECGNPSLMTAIFTIEDNTPPIITNSAQDTTINCSITDQQAAIQSWLNNNGGGRANDICGTVSW